MHHLDALFFGLIQGVTEFLPISSSGHTFLLGEWLGVEASLLLVVMVHAGSLVAVVYYFWRDVWRILTALFRAVQQRTLNLDATEGLKLGVATVLTVPTALLVEKVLPFSEVTMSLVAWTLMLTGVLILFAEYIPKRARSLSWGVIIALGLVQGFAVVPGLSRSGLTIAFLVLVGVARGSAARASFLLAIPTILGALIFTLRDIPASGATIAIVPLAVAFFASVVASVFSIKYMLKAVAGKWVWFAPYCFALAFTLLYLYG